MNRVDIYEYDKKNRRQILEKIDALNGEIFNWAYFVNFKKEDEQKPNIPDGTTEVFIDISSLFYNEDRLDSIIPVAEATLDLLCRERLAPIKIFVEQQYAKQVLELLYYRIERLKSLEEYLKIEKDPVTNIVDLGSEEFEDVLEYLRKNLFGNARFKQRLKEELIKYRLFNRIGRQPIFSVLICGASGIGKTEVARLLHQKLSPNEPMIKINFGNYSAQDALNSLIGSPRGYIGSNKGELPDKLMKSKSKVILIDEFEKASKAVYNFFLQLLEEGKFTDSLGREYDLNKYIIIFTSNMQKERVGEYLPPELRSRFSYKCALWPLSDQDKAEYVQYKGTQLLADIKEKCSDIDPNLKISDIVNIDVKKYTNMRDVNNEIMRQITNALYEVIMESNR